jgi:Periplasmic binding protein
VVNITHGDYEAAYQALFDDINATGGINGRTIEPVILGINPVGTDSADAACVELTEDDDAFIVIGFFLADAVTCVINTHQTAVIGGSMNAELLDQAQAPWYTTEAGTDVQSDVIRAIADAGEFDGSLGVFAAAGDEAQLNDVVLPLLDELGVEVTESAVVDAPADDIAAVNAATGVIAERFDSSGVDQVLTVGQSGLTWASGTESLDYRPQLLLTDPNSILAYAGDPGRDVSLLDGAVAGNLYGGAEEIYNLPAMQECIGVITDAGGVVDDPATNPEEDIETYVSAFTACNNVALLRALLEAAGEDLNYGTLAAGADGLEVQLPGDPEPATYGPPPAADGDRAAYLYDWDPDELDFVIRES